MGECVPWESMGAIGLTALLVVAVCLLWALTCVVSIALFNCQRDLGFRICCSLCARTPGERVVSGAWTAGAAALKSSVVSRREAHKKAFSPPKGTYNCD